MIAAGLALEPDPPTAVPSCATSAEMVIPRLSCSKPHTMALAYRFYKAATVSSSKVAWWRVRPLGLLARFQRFEAREGGAFSDDLRQARRRSGEGRFRQQATKQSADLLVGRFATIPTIACRPGRNDRQQRFVNGPARSARFLDSGNIRCKMRFADDLQRSVRPVLGLTGRN
jgi:hypothetical protein